MPTTRKLAQLFRAIAAEDVAGATAIAQELCKSEEQKGHRSAARLLRGALMSSGSNGGINPRIPTQGSANVLLSTALVHLTENRTLTDVMLSAALRQELRDVIKEWTNRATLQKHGINPRSKLLFHGPPGCGKSLTARTIGNELNLPVFLVRFDAVIGSFLGQTAGHLRQLFHFAEIHPCVLLLDELDALGKRRGNPLDVGELDRIVIALMQELEHSAPTGLIIATSNLARHLDDALWRRFDLALEFKAPSSQVLRPFANRLAKIHRVDLPPKVIQDALRARSFATAESIVISETRRQILDNA
ncbi:MAG TPA: ATP-binding protein [Tepidisphaeraceae bacterium]|jgi:AAA+ superfamily predicted ATPase|nr:ATP-binding protein [Tepidisphaeraceae bacterium]